MAHDQLQTIDLVIIGAYLIALVLIGVHFMKKVKNIGDYYIAGRTFGPHCYDGHRLRNNYRRQRIGWGEQASLTPTGLRLSRQPSLAMGMFIFSGISGRISAIGFQHNVSSMPDLFERRFW